MIKQIHDHAAARPNQIAVSDGDEGLTYSNLIRQVENVANRLQQIGLCRGQRLLYTNTSMPNYLVTLLACMQVGVTLVPAPPKAPKAWLNRLVTEFGINAVIEGSTNLQDGNLVLLHGNILNVQDDIVAIFTTSGTTGMPKGVPVHMAAIRAAASNTIQVFELDHTSIFINYAPPFTVGGLLFIGLPMLLSGSSNFLLPFSPYSFAKDISHYKPTHTFLLPTMISMLKVSSNWPMLDLSCLKFVGSGASPVSESMADELLARGAECFLHMYGSTECLSPVMRHLSKLSSGKRIVFSEMCGDYQMKLAEDGELLLQGTPITRGYLGDPVLNEQYFEAGWFKTGDLFAYDGPALRFVGRKKQILKIGGFSVYPVLTENTIIDFPGVRNCCVVTGVTRNGLEELVAVIEGANVEQRAILNHCREQLPPHQVPRRAIFVENIPLNAMRKIDRAAVTNMVSSDDPK